MKTAQYSIQKMGAHLGGLVEGIRLPELIPGDTPRLTEALWHYGVLVFRRQNLTPAEHTLVARAFGEPVLHEHASRVDGFPEIVRLTTSKGMTPGTDRFHSDVTYREVPISVTVMQAISMPRYGGDTLIASASRAYEMLPPPIKRLFLDLEAEHDYRYEAIRNDFAAKYADKTLGPEFFNSAKSVVHPMVIEHPFTGKTLLYVNELWTKKIVDLPRPIGDHLLQIAYDAIRLPEIQVRVHWEPGDVAVWDNFGVSHYGPVMDMSDETPRIMHRVQIQRDIGRPSINKEKALREIETAVS